MNDGATPGDAAGTVRRIWLVADDYGLSSSVNAAIRDLIARRRINATSVMVVAPSLDREQTDLLLENAGDARIGLHITLTAPFAPLTRAYMAARGAFRPLGRTAMDALLRRIDPEVLTNEVSAQVRAFASAFGRPPDFVDGHQHVHLFPGVSESVLAAVREFAPGAWIRQCGRAPNSSPDSKALVLDALSRRFRARAKARGIRMNTAFAGTYDFHPAARIADLFPKFLQGLPNGGLIMCHPGIVDAELARLDPLTHLREKEYEYLGGDTFPGVLAAARVALL